MAHSDSFWLLILEALIFTIMLAEVQGKQSTDSGTASMHIVDKRDVRTQSLYSATFAATLASEALSLTVGPVPFLGATASFIIGTLVNYLWPVNTFESMRAQFIQEIHTEMNYQSTQRMKLKLDDYRRQLNSLYNFLSVPDALLQNWQQSVQSNGLNVSRQRSVLQNMDNRLTEYDYAFFKQKIFAITADLQNDRNHFFNPHDPTSSLSYYREFASLELVLLATELLIHADESASSNAQTYTRQLTRSAAESHFRFVYWAAHKSAGLIETSTRDWQKYNGAVQSVLSKFPLDEWKLISNMNFEDTKYIRNGDEVSFKMVSLYYRDVPRGPFGVARIDDRSSRHYRWLSCWGSGSACDTNACPGEDNPFDSGYEYQYYFRCRGEVFAIFGDGRNIRGNIKVCDNVAIRYSYQGGNGYWVGYHQRGWSSGYYKTNTCPGFNFFNSNFNGRCNLEVFKLYVEGKSCGEKVEDRDVLKFNQGYFYVASRGGRTERYYDFNQWRVFKQDSFIKSP